MKEHKAESKDKRNPKRLLMLNTVLSFIMIVSILFVGGVANFTLAISDSVFAPGVFINNINVSKLTYKEAEELLSDRAQQLYAKARLNLIYEGNRTAFSAENLGIRLNFQDALAQAFNYDKNVTDTAIEQYNKKRALSKGVNFGGGFVDREKLFETINAYVQANSILAVDATVTLDKQTQTLVYTKEVVGKEIDAQELTSVILQKINNGDFSDLIVSNNVVYPKTTEAFLKSNTALIAEYETKAVNNVNRNTNIRLMCEAVNGICVNAGETISLNQLTGERTEAKGFKPAPAIVDGTSLKDQIGGGICQLSGTLYNAALAANMEIVERVRHSWPSSYLPVGLDATLNWDNKDLKIKNTTDMPVYILARFDKQKVKVQLFGKPLPQATTVEIQTEVTEVIPYNTEIQYTKELTPGAKKLLSSPREGYKVNVYRVYIQDGIIVQKQVISQDRYPPINKIILVGSNVDKD